MTVRRNGERKVRKNREQTALINVTDGLSDSFFSEG